MGPIQDPADSSTLAVMTPPIISMDGLHTESNYHQGPSLQILYILVKPLRHLVTQPEFLPLSISLVGNVTVGRGIAA